MRQTSGADRLFCVTPRPGVTLPAKRAPRRVGTKPTPERSSAEGHGGPPRKGYSAPTSFQNCPMCIVVLANHLWKPKNQSKFEIVYNYYFTPLANHIRALETLYFYAIINEIINILKDQFPEGCGSGYYLMILVPIERWRKFRFTKQN